MMMAKTHILALLTWTALQSVVTMCDTADTCVAVRPCDNAKNVASLESTMEKKLVDLQAALNSLAKQNTESVSSLESMDKKLVAVTEKLNLLENQTAEVSGVKMPWCYTTDPKKRWEFCPVPGCDEVGPRVAFSASLAGRESDVRVGPGATQTIVFKNVFFNNGMAYNPGTGIFTAPLKGAFQFTFTTFGFSGYHSGAKLVKNGQLQVSTWQSVGKHHSDSTSGAVILSLNRGDKVNLITWGKWGGNHFQVFDNSNHYSTFSGFLLFPL